MSTVPKSRISRSKRGMRRSHNHLRSYSARTCSNCKSTIVPFRVCLTCGWYKNRQVISS